MPDPGQDRVEQLAQPKRDAKAVLKTYMKTHPEKPVPTRVPLWKAAIGRIVPKREAPKEPLNLGNREEFKRIVAAYTRFASKKFVESIQRPEQFEVIGEKEKGVIPLHRKLLGDGTHPITLVMDRSIASDPRRGKNGVFSIRLLKGNHGEDEICAFSVRDYGNEFRLSHRYINPKFRDQGIGSIMLAGIEEFVRGYAEADPQREPVIDAYGAQLDVLSFFDSHGYASVDEMPPDGTTESKVEKIYLLDDVLDFAEGKNQNFKIGPLNYVFPGDLPEE